MSGSPNSFDDGVKAMNKSKQQDVPCRTPSKSPYTTNWMPSDIPTPAKQLNFDVEVNMEVEGGWVVYKGGWEFCLWISCDGITPKLRQSHRFVEC
ncbi:hypothetical protein Hdeb2414_s0001g00026051 [Helianthus debilis subsp. tardiflorus]